MRHPHPSTDRATIEQIIGDPKKLDEELQEFREDAKVLSTPGLIDKYPKRWIAIYEGEVRAEARSINEVLNSADKQGLPRESVIIQYVDRTPRTMIL